MTELLVQQEATVAVEKAERSVGQLIAGLPMVVTSREIRDIATDAIRGVKSRYNEIEAERKALTKPLNDTVDRINAMFKRPLAALKDAEGRGKAGVQRWDDEQERKRVEEQRRLQAEADERARKEREKLAREAAKLKTPELREARLEEAASIVAPVVMIAEPEKPKGESTRQRWKMKLTDKAALIAAAASGNDLAASLLTYDESAGNRIAPTIKNITTIPGVAIYAMSELAVKI